MMKRTVLLQTLVIASFLNSGWAAIQPASLFQDNAVLQREKPVPVWGKAVPRSKIRVTFRDQIKESEADESGDWSVRLDPMSAGERGDLVITGDGEVRLKNILVGEVWFASGQSNMSMPVYLSLNPEIEMPLANYPNIRFFQVKESTSTTPQTAFSGTWSAITPASVRGVSAVSYFFARDIHQKLGVPVGIIVSAWGGTPIEAWVSGRALEDPLFADTRARYDGYLKNLSANTEAYQKALQDWEGRKAEAEKSGTRFSISKPPVPVSPTDRSWISGLFNAMVNPAIPYAIRGALWYQGEANTAYYKYYGDLFAALIRDWRTRWDAGDFPFLFVQLPNWEQPRQPGELWAHMREAQASALKIPETRMVVTIDVGDANELHPKNKQAVAKRLALVALDEVYRVQSSPKSPIVSSWKINGPEIVVTLENASSLTWKTDSGKGFELAGADRIFHPASVKIQGDKVILSSDVVTSPIAFRYAWANAPTGVLFNDAGLPAAPYRSDSW